MSLLRHISPVFFMQLHSRSWARHVVNQCVTFWEKARKSFKRLTISVLPNYKREKSSIFCPKHGIAKRI
jgi:hypothetical protein